MSDSTLVLGESLRAAENEILCRKLASLAGAHDGDVLHADTVFSAWRGLQGADPGTPSASYLLFDLHRVILYREPSGADEARIGSVVRFIVDGYPFQPFDLLVRHFGGRPFSFLYSPDSLDIVPLVWSALPPGIVATLSLATGEITHASAHVHPEASPVRRSTAARLPATRLELHERHTGRSLRAGGTVNLDGLLSPVAAPVRELTEVANHASLRFGTARTMWGRGARREFAGGKSVRAGDGATVAMYEALERFHVGFQPAGEELVSGSYAELREKAVDPRTLFFGRCPGESRSHVQEFTDEAILNWTWAYDVPLGTPALVPAQEIWFNTIRLSGEEHFVAATSNGCAMGGSVEEAAVFALFEAIERDAYLTMWYLRRPCRRIDPDSIRYEPFQLLRRRWHAAYPDYGLYLFDIGTDVAVPTVAAVAVRLRQPNEGPRTFHAAAAHLSAERACFGALKDLTGFTPHFAPGRLDEMRRLLDAQEQVVGPTDHYEIYALDESFERLDFLDFGPGASLDVAELNRRAWIAAADSYELCAVIDCLAGHLRPLGVSTYLKDISHSWLTPRGLRCVKVITPGLYPLWFGSGAKRFAVTERLRRLARDFLGRDLDQPEDFNLEIHPFS
jgi:thiazole/oxazole-forming peptide maturase SagD family component